MGLISCLIPNITSAQCWQQKGTDLAGNDELENIGTSTCMSSDGMTVASGAPQYNNLAGRVVVHAWNGNAWIQKGTDLIGLTTFERFGTSVDISSDGNTLAIGARNNSDSATTSGAVRMYEWNDSVWQQKGSTIHGNLSGQGLGQFIDISDDGRVIAIGAPFRSTGAGTWETIGLVRTYHWNDTIDDWEQLGSDLTGIQEGDWFGNSVSLNGNGTVLAVGAYFSSVFGTYAGYARVFAFNNDDWQLHQTFEGADEESLGQDVDLTPDGHSLIIASGANNDDYLLAGKARIYHYDGIDYWNSRGEISGETSNCFLGQSVAINAAGDIIVVGGRSSANSPQWSDKGYMAAYSWLGGDQWQKIGEDIEGSVDNDLFGESVAISDDGNTIAGGAKQFDGNVSNVGLVRVYESCVASIKEKANHSFLFSPNPSSGIVETDLGEFYHSVTVTVKNSLGQIISKRTVSTQQLSVILPKNPGTYFIEVTTENGTSVQKVVKL
ncbi:MAG: hypothetical protein A3D31_04155 [Candidatus Fluviicola riflensis]|nr:MAG: hypothetical protein A3D31_04155 [Candidatus Fluviicola riflensis]OGS86602.1 MAG: hypothetical protein A2724_03615 [Fluviicola sp. RIFCSPHIGHO2_01_FULL_43_53]OGS88924.1 MAG: hypothetical protein A3E30_01045 [Fluviicola sp. RIFCSPHIGHO2_12_FULL_43_24]